MQTFISYHDFSGPLTSFAIALFIQSDFNHQKPFSRPISSIISDRPLSIALNLKSRLIVLVQFLRVLGLFYLISQNLKFVLILELRDMYPLMGLFGEVKGNDHASIHFGNSISD
jgi:hypothetical protein